MHVAHVLAARLHVMMNGVRRHTADLHQTIVLDKDRITGEVPVDDGRRTGMQIAICKNNKYIFKVQLRV